MVKMDLAFHFYPFTELGRSNSLISQITLTIQCPLNFLKFAIYWHGPLSKTAGHKLTSNIKEYIQGDLKYKGIYSGLHFCLVLI